MKQEPIFQIETAIGSAISNFEKSKIIIVDRDRFLPVKLCEDLLVKRSDFYFFGQFLFKESKSSKARTNC